jgi:hypothetical protein
MKSESVEKIVDLAATLAARADELDQVLVIYRYKENGEDVTHGSIDNGLQVDAALWLAEAFKQWLVLSAIGLLPKKY